MWVYAYENVGALEVMILDPMELVFSFHISFQLIVFSNKTEGSSVDLDDIGNKVSVDKG